MHYLSLFIFIHYTLHAIKHNTHDHALLNLAITHTHIYLLQFLLPCHHFQTVHIICTHCTIFHSFHNKPSCNPTLSHAYIISRSHITIIPYDLYQFLIIPYLSIIITHSHLISLYSYTNISIYIFIGTRRS